MTSYDISVEVAVAAPGLDVGALSVLAERVLTGEAVNHGTGVSILVTGDEHIQALNKEFLGIDEPTDVLSFPDEPGAEPFPGGDEEPYLGDIAISFPTALHQASELGHSIDAEFAHLLVHGILHLCGYDHVNSADEEAAMRAREEFYLGAGVHAQPHGPH